jgi:hypothetical protein
MRIVKKALCAFLILLSLSGLSVLAKNPNTKAAAQKSVTPAISAEQFTALQKSGWLNLADDGAMSAWWVANDQKSTTQKVILWLKAAKPYTEKIPRSANVVFYANVGPSTLFLRSADKRFISAEPAWYIVSSGNGRASVSYVKNVIKLDVYGKTAYVVSASLYDWLKKDLWKPAFREGFS